MFWDRVAFAYDVFVEVVNGRCHRELRRIVADAIGETDVVLECACGTGMLSDAICGRCQTLVACDLSPKMLERAAHNLRHRQNVTLEVADICHLPYKDASFDAVVAGNVIHLLDDPYAALAELDRVCRPGGSLIVATYLNRDERGRTSAFATGVGRAGAGFRRQFTSESYRSLFEEAGYTDVTVTVAEGRIPCAVAQMGRIAHGAGDSGAV